MDSSESTDIVYLTHLLVENNVVHTSQSWHGFKNSITIRSNPQKELLSNHTDLVLIKGVKLCSFASYIQSVAMFSCCILCCSSFSLTLLQACIVSSNIFSIDNWLLYKQTMRSIDWPVSLPDPWRASDRTQIGYRLAVQAMRLICHSVHNLSCYCTARGVLSC